MPAIGSESSRSLSLRSAQHTETLKERDKRERDTFPSFSAPKEHWELAEVDLAVNSSI